MILTKSNLREKNNFLKQKNMYEGCNIVICMFFVKNWDYKLLLAKLLID